MDTIKPKVAATVDEYLEALPDPVRKMLEKLRKTIKAAAPGAEELISYQIPTYKQHGPVIHFAVFKNHCSLIPVNDFIVAELGDELKAFKLKGSTLHFTVDNPLPATLVKKIVKLRLRHNKELVARKTASK